MKWHLLESVWSRTTNFCKFNNRKILSISVPVLQTSSVVKFDKDNKNNVSFAVSALVVGKRTCKLDKWDGLIMGVSFSVSRRRNADGTYRPEKIGKIRCHRACSIARSYSSTKNINTMHCGKFSLPVSVQGKELLHEQLIPRYIEIVSHPMNWVTLKTNLDSCHFIKSVKVPYYTFRFNVDKSVNEVQLDFVMQR